MVIDYGTNGKPVCNFILVVLSGTLRNVRRLKDQKLAPFPTHPDLMPSLGVILSEFPDEPYLAVN